MSVITSFAIMLAEWSPRISKTFHIATSPSHISERKVGVVPAASSHGWLNSYVMMCNSLSLADSERLVRLIHQVWKLRSSRTLEEDEVRA